VNLAFLALFILLQIADVWTTLTVLKMGGRELNPVLAPLFKRFSPLGVMIVFKVVAVWALWYANVWLVTMGLCAFYLWVVLNNWKAIQGK
jgi:hypothetical protein